jgi:hypothetical protein
VEKAWENKITANYIIKTCSSVLKRLRAIFHAQGGHIDGLAAARNHEDDEEDEDN